MCSSDLPPAPRGVPQVEVTFDIDANGILAVSAKDKSSGKEQSIRIEGSSGLDKGEIEKLVRDAQAHAADDKSRRERVDARNALDSLVYESEKTVREHREKIPIADLNEVEKQIAAAKEQLAIEDAPAERLRAAVESLQSVLHRVSQALYRQEAQPPGGAEGGAEGKKADGDVVDAEFTEEK